MDVELVEGKECGVWLGVDEDCLLPHDVCDHGVEVEGRGQAVNNVIPCEVVAISRNESVVGEGVHHRARSSDCKVGQSCPSRAGSERTYNH